MKESRVLAASLLSTALLFCTSAAVQLANQAQTKFLLNSPSSQFLSRELEPPLSDNFVPNTRFLSPASPPSRIPAPLPVPVPSFRQTIFTPNTRPEDKTGGAAYQTPARPLLSQTPSFSTFTTSYVNFQTNTQFQPARQLSPQQSIQQRLPGNKIVSTAFQSAAPFARGSVAGVNSPSPVTVQQHKDIASYRQPVPIQGQIAANRFQPAAPFTRGSVPVLNSPPPPTVPPQRDIVFRQPYRDTGVPRQDDRPGSASSVTFSSNDGRSFSYSSGLTVGPHVSPSGLAAELLPPFLDQTPSPRALPPQPIVSPAFASSKPFVLSRHNRFADAGSQDIKQSGDIAPPSTTVDLPPRNLVPSARSINTFLSLGQTNQISEPHRERPIDFANAAVNRLAENATSDPDSTPQRSGPRTELLPPLSLDLQSIRPQAFTKSQETPVLQKTQDPGQVNFITDHTEKAQSVPTNPPAENSSSDPSAPLAKAQPAFGSLLDVPIADFKVETIQPIIQDITIDTKEPTFSKAAAAIPQSPSSTGVTLDLQPPPTPPSSPLPIDLNQPKEKLQPSQDQPISGSLVSTAAEKLTEKTSDEILSTVVTFSTPLPPISTNQPSSTNAPLLPSSSQPSTSPPSTEETSTPFFRHPLVLDLQPPEDKVETPREPATEEHASRPTPEPEGFLIFDTPHHPPPTDQPAKATTLTVTSQGTTGVIKPQETVPTPASLTLPSTTRLETPPSQTSPLVPEIKQGSIFPAAASDQGSPLVPDTTKTPSTTLTADPLEPSPKTPEPTQPSDSEATFKSEGNSTQQRSSFLPSETPASSSPPPTTESSTISSPNKIELDGSKSSGLSAELVAPSAENREAKSKASSSPLTPPQDGAEASPESPSPAVPAFNLTTRVITKVTFSATHGPGTPCTQLDIQHKGYRAPQFLGKTFLSPGFYPTDNATNGTDGSRLCDTTDVVDGRKFNWWQILLEQGGEPSTLKSSGTPVPVPALKTPCVRPFETEGVPLYYNQTSSDLKSWYRQEVAYHRFPGAEHTFLESRGLLVWRPDSKSNDTASFLLHYIRDDTGFWLQVQNVNCTFTTGDQPNLKCHSLPECTCQDGGENKCSSPLPVLAKDLSDVKPWQK